MISLIQHGVKETLPCVLSHVQSFCVCMDLSVTKEDMKLSKLAHWRMSQGLRIS